MKIGTYPKYISATLAIILSMVMLSGCATMSNRTKTLLAMGVVGVAAGVAGAMSAPADESALAHGALWGGGGAAVAGVAGLFIFDEHARAQEMERQLQVSRQELDSLRWGGPSQEEKLIYESGTQDKGVPDELRTLLSPGWVRIYQTSAWVKQGDDSLVHQDKVIRIKKPQLIPNADFNDGEKSK